MVAEWSRLPEDVAPKILVHVLLEWKVPWREIDFTCEKNLILRRQYVREMRQLNRAFASVFRPIGLVHVVPDRPYYVDRFVEGVLRILGQQVREGYKNLGEELRCYLNRTFYVDANVRPFPPNVARHYYSCIAGTLLRLLTDGTIRVPTHKQVEGMAWDVDNIFMPLFCNSKGYNGANVTWCFNANLPQPGTVVYSLLCPTTWFHSYETCRNHPGSVIV